MKEATRTSEAVAIAKIKAFTKRRRTRNSEETLQKKIMETIEETVKQQGMLEEGLKKMNTGKIKVE